MQRIRDSITNNGVRSLLDEPIHLSKDYIFKLKSNDANGISFTSAATFVCRAWIISDVFQRDIKCLSACDIKAHMNWFVSHFSLAAVSMGFLNLSRPIHSEFSSCCTLMNSILKASRKNTVTRLLAHWSYCSLALDHRYVVILGVFTV